MRLIDYLSTRADVNPEKIGLIGNSKGGTEAYLAAAVTPTGGLFVLLILIAGDQTATVALSIEPDHSS